MIFWAIYPGTKSPFFEKIFKIFLKTIILENLRLFDRWISFLKGQWYSQGPEKKYNFENFWIFGKIYFPLSYFGYLCS
jgi:hypothetical protein